MDLKKELLKFKKKELDINLGKKQDEENDGAIGKEIKKEIKKGTMLVQAEISSLKLNIEKLNLESESLKEEVFNLKKQLKNKNTLILEVLSNNQVVNHLELNNESKEKIDLMLEKEEYILNKVGINLLAKEGMNYNPKYHEAMNRDVEDKGIYHIDKVVEQGYSEDGKILKQAKVIIK